MTKEDQTMKPEDQGEVSLSPQELTEDAVPLCFVLGVATIVFGFPIGLVIKVIDPPDGLAVILFLPALIPMITAAGGLMWGVISLVIYGIIKGAGVIQETNFEDSENLHKLLVFPVFQLQASGKLPTSWQATTIGFMVWWATVVIAVVVVVIKMS